MSLGKMNTPQEVAHSCEILSQTLTEKKKSIATIKLHPWLQQEGSLAQAFGIPEF